MMRRVNPNSVYFPSAMPIVREYLQTRMLPVQLQPYKRSIVRVHPGVPNEPSPIFGHPTFVALFAIALFLAGCGGSPRQTQPSETAPPPAPVVDPATAGSISGKVIYDGNPIKMPALDMSATPACARMHPTDAISEQVVVNDNHTLRWSFVWIKSGLPAGRWPVPSQPAVLAQTGCIYHPHVLGLMTGQELEILNNDSANHNIHPLSRNNPEWNEAQPPKGDPKFHTFAREEIMIPVKCNVHPWMRTYLGVVSHPFFAVTGPDGAFQIEGLPPGAYTLAVWHEKFGTREVPVTVGPKQAKTVDFTFKG